MECNKRSRNICYASFRYLNLNQISNFFAKSNKTIFSYICDRFSKLKGFFCFWIHHVFTFLADCSKRNGALF